MASGTTTGTKPLALPMLPQGIAGPELQPLVLQINDRLRRIATGVAAATATAPSTGTTGPPATTGVNAISEVPSGVQNSINKNFSLSHTPVAGSEHVYRNGVDQDPNWLTISGSALTFAVAPRADDQLWASYLY